MSIRSAIHHLQENVLMRRSTFNHFILICASCIVLASAAASLAADFAWQPTGAMNVARGGHTATLLPDGRVLVAGGGARGGPLDSAELYDPVTGIWSMTGRMGAPRVKHTATLLADGRVLVAGGGNAGRLMNSAELFDPVTGTWAPTGNMISACAWHTATLLQDGTVLVGPRCDSRAAEIYDPVAGVWSETGKVDFWAVGPSAAMLGDGSVLFVDWAAERFDPSTQQWSPVGFRPDFTTNRTATVVPSGNVLVAGGLVDIDDVTSASTDDSQLFDPVASVWSSVGKLITARDLHTATLLPNGNVLVAGGERFLQSGTLELLDSSESFDANTATWSSAGNLKTARLEHTATLLADGRVLVAGGFAKDTIDAALSSAELYAPQATLAATAIGPGLSGEWFDPAQSGQGLFVEVLPDNRFLALWATFSPAGAQAWFVGIGTYSGNVATVASMVQPSGGRWIPNYDPTQIASNAWGTLTFTFTDCNHGRVDFNSVAGYGSGSMDLTRLTMPAGLTCP